MLNPPTHSAETETGAPSSDRRSLLAWIALALAALALRLGSVGYGLDFDDPRRARHDVDVDELGMVREELALLRGDWDPGLFLMRGTGPFYVAGLVDAAVLGAVATARGEPWGETVARYERNPSLVFLVHRLLVVLAGAATVVVVARVCRRELEPLGGRGAGWIAGLFLACAHIHVQLSRLGMVDVPWVLFGMLASSRALRIASAPSASRRRDYVWAGVWVGVAGATKYPGALVAATVLLGHLAGRSRARRAGASPPSWSLLAVAAATSIAVFLAFSPRLLLAPGAYVDAMRTQFEILGIADAGKGGTSFGQLALFYLESSVHGLGEPVVLLALVGALVGGARGGPCGRIVVACLVLVSTAFVAKLPAQRFSTGLVVGLVPLATIGFVALFARAPRSLRVAAALACVAPSLARVMTTALVLSRQDTRTEMLDELEARGTTREEVLGVGHRGLPQITGAREPFVVMIAELKRERTTRADVVKDLPRYVLRDASGLSIRDGWIWRVVEDVVAADYVEVFRADGRRDPSAEPRPLVEYLVQRSFVPYADPWTVTRPGPVLVLYERRDAASGAAH